MVKKRKRKFTADVYMPLVMGDFLRQTSGMRADELGVYTRLIIHQWDNGYISADVDDLANIHPEVNKVWRKLKEKFTEFEPGKLRNNDVEEVRSFFRKQAKNAGKANSNQYVTPDATPNVTPKDTPNTPPHNGFESDNDIELKLKESLDELYLDQQRVKWSQIDFDFEYRSFCEKVRGSPDHYRAHDTGGIRLAFQAQLRNAKKTPNGSSQTKQQRNTESLVTGFAKRYGSDAGK